MLIIGSKEQVKKFLKKDSSGFYVYLLRKPNKTPFYVGKGCGNRVFQHEYDAEHSAFCNPYKVKVIKNIRKKNAEIIYEIDSFHMSEEEAFLRENELIQQIGQPPLTNLSGNDLNTSHGYLIWYLSGMFKKIAKKILN